MLLVWGSPYSRYSPHNLALCDSGSVISAVGVSRIGLLLLLPAFLRGPTHQSHHDRVSTHTPHRVIPKSSHYSHTPSSHTTIRSVLTHPVESHHNPVSTHTPTSSHTTILSVPTHPIKSHYDLISTHTPQRVTSRSGQYSHTLSSHITIR